METTLELLGTSTLIGGALVMVSILLGLMTARAGMPLLLIFLGVGMLAGEDGIGQIVFNNHQLSFWIANISLAIILFDGGLRTQYSTFRTALKPAVTLATVGVVITAGVLAIAAHQLLSVPFLWALLFGAIVSSTDAAAVFALLRNSGVRLNERVESVLELESGVNDPAAVFLTLLAISLLTVHPSGSMDNFGWALVWMLVKQAGLGLATAYVCARLFGRLARLSQVDRSGNQGLNALLVASAGMATFGLATTIGGSGYLAIYIFGLILGNTRARYTRSIVPAMDGLAWLCQASMFLLLGLLASPTSVMQSMGSGVALALLLMFVARPLAVFPCLVFFRFTFREMVFVSWVGLRGAVPIVLAIFPVIAGVDGDKRMLDLAFMVVILSLLFQGATVPLLAKWLGLVLPDASDSRAMRQLFGDFVLDGQASMADVCDFYGLAPDLADASQPSIATWMTQQLGKPPIQGDAVRAGALVLTVSEMADGRITKVGIKQFK
ncbi:MAG TPA: potassium/proton antiporter [Burkholderiaceae bacterium]|mgnify:CR=1 FL=1|nr:potassium/proton antiporter [Burkholderiaceae bacterium]